MRPMFDFTLDATSGPARAGTLTLPHGTVETPVFMPVGTQGTVRALSPNDLRDAGATLVLANTYDLHVRPGEQVVEKLGALHRFMGWDRPLLTDSGGFQVFSLEGFRRVDDDGVEFQSHVDGGRRTLTPERATEIQWALGADIAMAFDHVVPGGADGATARDALERTMRWLERCGRRHEELKASYDATSLRRKSSPGEDVQRSVGASCNQTLWPILQGGTHLELRTEGLRRILELGTWTGLAIGGLSVGEPKAVMYDMLERLEPKLPAIPRYLMGVGFPEDLVAAVERGVDLFDCVAPTRNGRNGSAFTPSGPNAGGGMTVFLVQIGALIAIFYFMLIRPQRRQQERHRQLLASLQRGDRIVTSGGIIGEVVHLKDDEVTVKSGESRLIVQRANIANILNRPVEAAKPQ